MHTWILIHFPLKLWNIFHQLKQNKTKLQQVVFKLDNITVHGILMKPIVGVPRLQLNNVRRFQYGQSDLILYTTENRN